MTLSRLAARLMEIASVADVRARPKTEKTTAVPYSKPEDLPPMTHPGPVTSPKVMTTSKAGLDLIKSFEDCARDIGGGRFEAYLCPAKVWTIGWGSTRGFDGKAIQPGTVWTQEQCDRKKAEDMAAFERELRAILGNTPTTQGQFDAMVSFAYNIGSDDLRKSTLMRLHKRGDHDGAAKQFLRWNRAGGKVLRGLTRRREEEAALYRSGS